MSIRSLAVLSYHCRSGSTIAAIPIMRLGGPPVTGIRQRSSTRQRCHGHHYRTPASAPVLFSAGRITCYGDTLSGSATGARIGSRKRNLSPTRRATYLPHAAAPRRAAGSICDPAGNAGGRRCDARQAAPAMTARFYPPISRCANHIVVVCDSPHASGGTERLRQSEAPYAVRRFFVGHRSCACRGTRTSFQRAG